MGIMEMKREDNKQYLRLVVKQGNKKVKAGGFPALKAIWE